MRKIFILTLFTGMFLFFANEVSKREVSAQQYNQPTTVLCPHCQSHNLVKGIGKYTCFNCKEIFDVILSVPQATSVPTYQPPVYYTPPPTYYYTPPPVVYDYYPPPPPPVYYYPYYGGFYGSGLNLNFGFRFGHRHHRCW